MRDVRAADERGFLDGTEMSVDYWTVLGRFEADSVRKSTLIQFVSEYPRSSVRISTLVRRTARMHQLPSGITSGSPQSRAPIWVYSRGFDSIRPR